MSRLFTTLAVFFVFLTTTAFLAPHGFGGEFGILLHIVPAGTLLTVADALGLYVAPNGAILRSAHGPPFLAPLGVLLVYALPAVFFAALAVPTGAPRKRR